MTEAERKFWRAEFAMLDRLYEARQKDARRLIDAYDLKFKDKIRDLKKSEYVRVSEFYPVVREVLATICSNYPAMYFEVDDDEAHMPQADEQLSVEDLLERASRSMFEITKVKDHVTQATLDALFCRVGKIGIDYNPPGDDYLPPWTANSPSEEDMVSFQRRPPFYVHIDPMAPPHTIGHARYIREKMWVPLKALRDDKTIQHRKDLKATKINEEQGLGMGGLLYDKPDDDEQAALTEAVKNGEFVLVDRVHVRTHVPGSNPNKDPRRLVIFAPGIDEPIKDAPHPFMRRTFPQRMVPQFDADSMSFFDAPMMDEETGEPVLDMETKGSDGEPGEPATGWLVPNGFPIVPVKLDVHPTSFYPKAHFEYLEDIQNGIVESLSRMGSMLKRFSRQGFVNQSEIEGNAKGMEILNAVRRGEDGEWHVVIDHTNWKSIDFGRMPEGQAEFEDRLRMYADRISRMRAIEDKPGTMTATHAALLGAAAEVNEQWGEAAVSRVYIDLTKGGFSIMGDPRYTPESFMVNVAPTGQQRFSRILTTADFQWNYRIRVQSGSMQPMFEQMQQDRLLSFYDRALNDPNYDRRELSKMLANAFDQDPEKLMIDEENVEAQRAAQMENQRIVTQLSDPGVLPKQDHKAHEQIHANYQAEPTYQQLVMQAQQTLPNGMVANTQAAAQIQQVDAMMAQHRQAHTAILQQQENTAVGQRGGGQASAASMPQGLVGQVRSNAQETSQAAQMEAAR